MGDITWSSKTRLHPYRRVTIATCQLRNCARLEEVIIWLTDANRFTLTCARRNNARFRCYANVQRYFRSDVDFTLTLQRET